VQAGRWSSEVQLIDAYLGLGGGKQGLRGHTPSARREEGLRGHTPSAGREEGLRGHSRSKASWQGRLT